MTEFIIIFGALLGGYVSGLTGFGTGLTALPIWLFAVQPFVAGPIVVFCSLVAQLQTLPSIWKSISWKRIAPFLVSAVIGVPIGTQLLRYFDSDTFRVVIGFLLTFYSLTMLFTRKRTKSFNINGSRISDPLIGFGGGILGGAAGLSGVLPTIWISLHNLGKNEKRGFFQGFNLVVLSFSLVSMWIAGFITIEVAKFAVMAIPATLSGAWLGRKTYNKLGDAGFDLVVLLVFLTSGMSIIIFWLSTNLLGTGS